ncbi:hypothetical protein CISIN_1g035906mg, partial [Citrus sinensis]
PNSRSSPKRILTERSYDQPKIHNFKLSDFGNQKRWFGNNWFEKFRYWFEYSKKKDAAFCLFFETTNIIIKEMGDVLFSILIDKSRDISAKEQMTRFIGLEHVASTTSISLKEAIDKLFSRHRLSMSRLLGQGYDGASNIWCDNKCAYFIHCFAHQLHLTLISIAKKHEEVNSLFNLVIMLVNVVGASAKCRDILQEKHAQLVIKVFDDGELSSGQGLNQEVTLKRSADTCWAHIMHDINVPNMDHLFRTQGRSQSKAQKIKNLHRFRVELCYAILDMQLQELSNRFNETNTELLLCVAFNLVALETQLDVYIMDVGSENKFSGLKRIGELARKLVETKKDKLYSLVYLLVTLLLILPVATTTIESAFSVMNFVKNRLGNRMGDQWLNDSLVVYIEKYIFCSLDNDVILQRFQHMKPC